MALEVFGTVWNSGELADKSVFTKFKFKSNLILKGIVTNIIVFNDPTFTSLSLNIYSDRGGLPDVLLATSTNSQTKEAVHTLANANKALFFQFAEQAFAGEVFYHLVMSAVGYSPTAAKYLAREVQTTDPIYVGGDTDPIKYAINPHKFSVISSDVE